MLLLFNNTKCFGKHKMNKYYFRGYAIRKKRTLLFRHTLELYLFCVMVKKCVATFETESLRFYVRGFSIIGSYALFYFGEIYEFKQRKNLLLYRTP